MLLYILSNFNESVSYPTEPFFIQDGKSLFHSLKYLPPTFGGICLKILDQMGPKKNFVFWTDSYDIYSVKAQERVRPGSSQQFRIDGPATRKPPDMKTFLKYDQNKKTVVWSTTMNGVVRRLCLELNHALNFFSLLKAKHTR